MIKQDQRLSCEFEHYPSLCAKFIREAMLSETHFWVELTIHFDGSSRLEIKRRTSLKTFTVLAIDFSPMPEEIVRQSIGFRHMALSSKIGIMERRILDVFELLSRKNPCLLLDIQKELE